MPEVAQVQLIQKLPGSIRQEDANLGKTAISASHDKSACPGANGDDDEGGAGLSAIGWKISSHTKGRRA
jgi:hypothetical protein